MAVPEHEFAEALGARVRKRREGAGVTQLRLAELVGLPRTSLVLVERGRQNLSAYTLVRISEVLHADPRELLLGEPLDAAAREEPQMPPKTPDVVREFVTNVRQAAGATRAGGR